MVFRNQLISDQEWVLKAPYDLGEARFKPKDVEVLACLLINARERGPIIKLNGMPDANCA
ncbi:hypothetical protein D9M71_791980 [compost metagenome]